MLKKLTIITLLFLLLSVYFGYAQQGVSINIAGTPPDNSAMLDVSSANKGLLIPRVSLTGINDGATILLPATSLLVYNLGTGGLSPAGYYYNSGTPGSPLWVQAIGPMGPAGPTGANGATGLQGSTGLAGPTGPSGADGATGPAGVTGPTGSGGGNAWLLLGNAGTTPGTNFMGTTDDKDVVFKRNNIQAGLLNFNGSDGTTSWGVSALQSNTTGTTNTAVGWQALWHNTTGYWNTAIGALALRENIGGIHNTACGMQALYNNTSGNYNTATGFQALALYNMGDNNTADGWMSLYYNTGSGNTASGVQALFGNSSGINNTALGYLAYSSSTAYSNSMALGYNTQVSNSNMVNVGNASIGSIQGQVGFTTYSDARIKNKVQENVPGLAFIKELRPVTYYYDIDKENEISGTKDTARWEGKYDIEKIQFSGFLAQEVDAAANKIGYNFSGVDKSGTLWGLRYAEFVVPLVKAVQEQQVMINELKKQNEQIPTLISEIELLKKEMKELKAK
jgi:hypothetical protein